MTIDTLFSILKYLDFYGISFNFYTEGSRKLYTPLGGLLSLISIFLGIIIFIYINLEDFLHNNPISTTSVEREQYLNITFKKEKIWIPWRVRDFGGKTINHTNILYPIIYYYHGIRNKDSKKMEISNEFINYKLCNETSMVYYSNLYTIDININNLYCIDMEDLYIGGSWDADFLNLITFDLYTCKGGIDYDGKNNNCTNYDKLAEIAGRNDSFEFEIYYPIVQYQPVNKTIPIFIRYYNYFYHLSRYSNKIDRLYLQKHILKDDLGWFLKNEKKYSNWGCASLSGDSYATGDKRDLMNEGSTSRLYSFNIYLKPEVVYYNRYYKKIYLIFAEGLPLVNVIFVIFGLFAHIFKISSGNKKLTELLFENLKKIKNNKKNFISKKYIEFKKTFEENKNININNKNDNSDFINKKILYDISSAKLNQQFSEKKIFNELVKKKSMESKARSKSLFFKNASSINSNINSNVSNDKNNLDSSFIFKTKGLFSDSNDNFSDMKNEKYYSIKNASKIIKKAKTRYIKKTLFPYRYYLCSIFIKNLDVSEKSFFLTRKFIVVYSFIGQLFDISSYLMLQKEFEIMKNTILVDEYRRVMENRKKINVNEALFNYNMKECLDSKKLSILGQLNNY